MIGSGDCLLGCDAEELRKLLADAGVDAEAGAAEGAAITLPGEWQEGAESNASDTASPQQETTAALRRQGERAANGEEAPPTNAAIYFRDISATSLLTAEEEIELAQEIERGEDAKRTLERGALLSEAEHDELEPLVIEGERARSRLTEANLRLVVSVARKYLNRGLPM